jgi:hypothetical protein
MRLDNLHDVLRSVIELDEPPVAADPVAVFARADRIRTRQRIAAVCAGIAVGGLAIGSAAVAVKASAPQGHRVAASPPTSPTATSASPTPSPALRPDVPANRMMATLLHLLPAGATVSDQSGQDGFAALVLTDARGKTRVEVNVEPNIAGGAAKGGGADELHHLFDCADRGNPPHTSCTATTLPDGTLVMTTDGPPEDNGNDRIVRRMVDTLRPDLIRIVIVEWNAVHEKTNQATRPTPLLTLAQLQAIATDPAWTS